MKKWLLLLTGTIACCVFAQKNTEKTPCSLTPLQNLIKVARNEKELSYLATKGIDFNPEVKCGGTPLQLAIRRGNPKLVKVLLDNKADVFEPVSLKDFPIEGAPEKVPLICFAAYYAPDAQILRLLVEAGTNIVEKDENGETVLWYLSQNPVLSNTQIQDVFAQAILLTKPAPKEVVQEAIDPKKYVPSRPILLDAEPEMPLPK